MTAAAESRPWAESGRRRVVLWLVLQALAIAAAIWLGGLSFPLPADQDRAGGVTFRWLDAPEAAALPVRLPHNWMLHSREPRAGLYSIALVHPGEEALAQGLSIFVPRFTARAVVRFNGQVLVASASNPAMETPARNTSLYAQVPRYLWAERDNRIEIEIASRTLISGYLGPVYIGPQARLLPAHQKRLILFVYLPVVLAVLSLFLAGLLLVFWHRGAGGRAYAVMALSLALSTTHALNLFPTSLFFEPTLHLVLHALPVIEAPISAIAMAEILGRRRPFGFWIVLPGLAIVASYGLFGLHAFVLGMMLFGMPMVAFSLAIILWQSSRSAIDEGNRLGLFLSLAMSVTLFFLLHDMLVTANVLSDQRILLARFFYPLFTVVLATWIIIRLARTLDEARNFANILATRVQEVEGELRRSFEREQTHRQERLLTIERARLMRDLHDGVGGQLVSIVANVERQGTSRAAIAEAARTALNDMRLVIDAMDEVDGELMLILAAWRERLEGRLRASGLALDWVLDSPGGLPVFTGLRPSHAINILRIMEEAVTNAIKHAGARRLTIRLGQRTDEAGRVHGSITVADDGAGYGPEVRPGRGLGNMDKRAAMLGGQLTVRSSAAGTAVRLDLPVVMTALSPP